MQGRLTRESNFELLRIVCMLFVIGGHVISFGTHTWIFQSEYFLGGVDFVISEIIKSFCCVAVNVYVLISGFWGIKLKFHKLIKIELMTLFYSLVILVVLLSRGGNLHSLLMYLLPFTSKHFWFITVYIVLCLMSPLLNGVCEYMPKKQFQSFLVGAIIIVYIYGLRFPMFSTLIS